MTGWLDRLRGAVRRPLPLACHPLYRFYPGGSLTRQFRGLPERPDDFWSEDWVGSCTMAGNSDPDGQPQGLSVVQVPGAGQVTLAELAEALDTPGDGREPAYAGIGFQPGIDRSWFPGAVARHDNAAIRATLHRTGLQPGDVYVAHAGVPHYLGPRLSFIEIQEPSDHIVIPETDGADDAQATMGLGWDLALDMIDYTGSDAQAAMSRARQQPRVLRTSHGSREVRLVHDDVLPFFDATALEVSDDIEVSDGRFSVAVVVSGSGSAEGDFGRQPLRSGETYALPASLALRVRAGSAGPVRVIRCLGPGGESR